METKKNTNKHLNGNSSLHFSLGLAMILALTYVALEWKTEDDNKDFTTHVETGDELNEKVPLVILKTLPPPPPPVNPPSLEIKPDNFKGQETEVAIFQTIDDPIIAVDSVHYIKPDDDPIINIGQVEEVPIFPGCENVKDRHACFNTMMQKHIVKNFRYPETAMNLNIQGRVHIMFEIQKDGSIGKVRLRGPDKTLEKEAARIIGKLPKMTPGKQAGKNVRVPFSIPITFKLNQ